MEFFEELGFDLDSIVAAIKELWETFLALFDKVDIDADPYVAE